MLVVKFATAKNHQWRNFLCARTPGRTHAYLKRKKIYRKFPTCVFSNFSNWPINKKVISVLKKILRFAQMILSLASNLIWKRAEFQIYKRFTLLYKIGFIYNPIFICHIPWNCRRRLYFNLKIQNFPRGDTPVPLQNFWPHNYYLRLPHWGMTHN